MPKFNENSALLFTRCVEAGIESPGELANIMGNASVETKGLQHDARRPAVFLRR
jgi:hypothetical protein